MIMTHIIQWESNRIHVKPSESSQQSPFALGQRKVHDIRFNIIRLSRSDSDSQH